MNRPLPDQPQWITLPEAIEAWETGSGSGIKIAILDSGINTSHPALAGLELLDDLAFEWADDGLPVVVPGNGQDPYGHGTAVAYIAHNAAPEAKIGSFRVLGTGAGGSGEAAVVREGVRAAIERGYHILNCSFGIAGTYRDPGRKLRFVDQNKLWLDEAYLNNLHVVSSCNNTDPRHIEWPGHFATSITVDKADCEPDEFFHCPGSLVEFAAKGYSVQVPWTGNTWKTMSGSSFAAPRVSGWLARLLSAYPFLSPPQVKGLLRHISLERPHLPLHSRWRHGRA